VEGEHENNEKRRQIMARLKKSLEIQGRHEDLLLSQRFSMSKKQQLTPVSSNARSRQESEEMYVERVKIYQDRVLREVIMVIKDDTLQFMYPGASTFVMNPINCRFGIK
jgi:hypothetical protein